MLFWKDVGNWILLDRPLPFKLHQSYRPLPRFIWEFNPASQEIWSGPAVPAGQPRECRPLARGLRALRRHCITHRHDSVIDITKWAQEYFQKPLAVNTICRAICRCQLKLYHAKRKPYVNMVQKCHRVLWAFDILVGNHGRHVLQAKEEGDLSACYLRSVQKPASLMLWGCISAYGMGSLHVLEGTMNAERYIKVLEQHMLPSRWRVLHLHLHLVIWQTLLSKATYNWGIHKAIHLEEAIRQRKCS